MAVPDAYRAQLYLRRLRLGLQHLGATLSGFGLEQHDVEAALESLELTLAGDLDAIVLPTIALELAIARHLGLLNGTTPEWRYESCFVADQRWQPWVRALLPRYGRLDDLIGSYVDTTVAAVTQAVKRLVGDWRDVRRAFLGRGESRLRGIGLAGDADRLSVMICGTLVGIRRLTVPRSGLRFPRTWKPFAPLRCILLPASASATLTLLPFRSHPGQGLGAVHGAAVRHQEAHHPSVGARRDGNGIAAARPGHHCDRLAPENELAAHRSVQQTNPAHDGREDQPLVHVDVLALGQIEVGQLERILRDRAGGLLPRALIGQSSRGADRLGSHHATRPVVSAALAGSWIPWPNDRSLTGVPASELGGGCLSSSPRAAASSSLSTERTLASGSAALTGPPRAPAPISTKVVKPACHMFRTAWAKRTGRTTPSGTSRRMASAPAWGPASTVE